MTVASVSAQPDELDTYVAMVSAPRDSLLIDANELAVAYAAASPYTASPNGVFDLSEELRAYVHACRARDEWVGRVAEAFRKADRGGRMPVVRRPVSPLVVIRPVTSSPASLAPGQRTSLDPWVASVAISGAEWERLVVPRGADAGTLPRYTGEGRAIVYGGRQYPIVVPWITRGGELFNADRLDTWGPDSSPVLTLDGTDPGWRTTAWSTGLHQSPAASNGATAFWGGVAASAGHTLTYMPPAFYLTNLRVSANGVATIGSTHRDALEPPAHPPDPLPDPDDVAPPGRTVAAGVDGFEMLLAAAAAFRADHYRQWGLYQVVLQQNGDGRTRALVRVYQVSRRNGGEPRIHADYWTGVHGVAMIPLTAQAERQDDGQRRR